MPKIIGVFNAKFWLTFSVDGQVNYSDYYSVSILTLVFTIIFGFLLVLGMNLVSYNKSYSSKKEIFKIYISVRAQCILGSHNQPSF